MADHKQDFNGWTLYADHGDLPNEGEEAFDVFNSLFSEVGFVAVATYLSFNEDCYGDFVSLIIGGDDARIDWFYPHMAEGHKMVQSYINMSAAQLRKAFNVEDNESLVDAITSFAHFEKAGLMLKGWSELGSYLGSHGVHFENFSDRDVCHVWDDFDDSFDTDEVQNENLES